MLTTRRRLDRTIRSRASGSFWWMMRRASAFSSSAVSRRDSLIWRRYSWSPDWTAADDISLPLAVPGHDSSRRLPITPALAVLFVATCQGWYRPGGVGALRAGGAQVPLTGRGWVGPDG